MTAILLILLILLHGVERSRKAFADDGQQMQMPVSNKIRVDTEAGS
jgi:hypothetical protein